MTAIERSRTRGSVSRVLGWGGAALLLLLPALANAPWTASDFLFAGILIGGVGLLVELAAWKAPNAAYFGGAAAALLAAFMTIWVSAAVGMIGDGDNPLNLMFAGVLGIALVGALAARLRSAGMARVMAVAAVAQLAAGAIGATADLLGGIFSAGFALVWLVSALLFGKSAREERL